MTIKDNLKNRINQAIESLYKINDIDFKVEYPRDAKYGDYATNAAMILARKKICASSKSVLKIGEEIKEHMINEDSKEKMFGKIEVASPGFINFSLSLGFLSIELKKIIGENEYYGSSNIGRGEVAVIDYSAPNIAKKMHVGHLRSSVIGAAIYNLFNFLGFEAVRDNHLGDWGTQFGKLIYEYKQKYGRVINESITVEEMERLYIDFHKKAKDNIDLNEEARKELKKLQDKDEFNFKLWQFFYEVSIKEFKKIYALLEIDFDVWQGESFYNDMLSDVVKQALSNGIAEKSAGAVVIPLGEYNLPDLLIEKSDGAFLYSTTDLATIKYRRDYFHSKRNIYVVASQQELYFKQLFKCSQLLGLHGEEEMAHVAFGLILGNDGKKMSTREGEVADLSGLIMEGIGRARSRVAQKNADLSNEELDNIARAIAIGAIKYNDLSQNRMTDIKFDWDRMLSLESGSSPYLQYTYVRIASIFRKLGAVSGILWKKEYDNLLAGEKEQAIIRQLVKFSEVIIEAFDEYKPNLIALYLEDLAGKFHSFYENTHIVVDDHTLMMARLYLIKNVGIVIKNGLKLLGIDVLERM